MSLPGAARWSLLLALGALASQAWAHGGESHGDAGPDVATPRDVVTVSKPLQRALAITTQRIADLAPARSPTLLAEAHPQPETRSRLQAPEPGRLQSAGRWPVAGQAVKAGELLAVLVPALSQQERSRREVQLASLEQRMTISRINVDRMRLQARVTGVGAEGNTYLEQTVAEFETLQRQIELAHQSLEGRVEVRAGEAGRLQSVRVAAGDVVARGQPLFELAGAHPRLSVRVYDRQFLLAGQRAQARVGGQVYPLHGIGSSPATPEPGWTLWLDFDGAAPELAPGALVELALSTADGGQSPALIRLPRASVQGDAQQAWVWRHVSAERFDRRPVRVLDWQRDAVLAEATLQPQDRIAVQGAAMLDQIH